MKLNFSWLKQKGIHWLLGDLVEFKKELNSQATETAGS